METVTLRTFDNYFSANLLLTRLRDAGIECYLKDEYTVTIDPLLSNSLGGIKIIVKRAHLNDAIQMLKHFEEQQKQMAICPVCSGTQFTRIASNSPRNVAQVIFNWIFSSHDTPIDLVYKCDSCGNETEKLPLPNSD